MTYPHPHNTRTTPAQRAMAKEKHVLNAQAIGGLCVNRWTVASPAQRASIASTRFPKNSLGRSQSPMARGFHRDTHCHA
jgi:hypothetical protein